MAEPDILRRANLPEFIHEAVIALDPNERIAYWNPGAERTYGWTAAEAIGRTPFELIGPVGDERDAAALSGRLETLRGGGTLTGEFETRRRDGSLIWVEATARAIFDADGRPAGIVAVHRDVTARRRAEAQLRESEARLRALVEASPLGIDIMDLAGNPVFYNPRCEELHGIRFKEATGRGWSEAIHPDDRERIVSSWYAAASEMRPWSGTYRFLHRDGRVVWVSGRTAPMFVDGRPIGFVGMLEDITALKEAEADRQRLLEREREARAQAELATRQREETLAVVAHDLRNFANTVRLSAALLEHPGLPESERAGHLGVIKRTAKATELLVRDLVDVSRIESRTLALERSPVHAHELLADAMELMQPRASTLGITLECPHVAGEITLHADRGRLARVLANLLDNALKFTPAGGRVVLQADRTGDEVRFSVQDSGRGIAPEVLPHLFDRFWQASRTSRAGAGLGLAIAKGIVEAHGGRIWAESTPGRGATFHFTVPAAQSRRDRSPEVPDIDLCGREH